MMAEKARLFGDEEMGVQILKSQSPQVAKQLGRQVKGFREQGWSEARFELVVAGNLAKFDQNSELKADRLGTKDKVLVEASPTDRIWGIGLAADSDQATNPEQWRRLNLLGFALMEVRQRLRIAKFHAAQQTLAQPTGAHGANDNQSRDTRASG